MWSGVTAGHPQGMAKAIEMFLDERADAAGRGTLAPAHRLGLSSLETYGHARHRPHISLTVTSDWNPDLNPGALDDIGSAVGARSGLDPEF